MTRTALLALVLALGASADRYALVARPDGTALLVMKSSGGSGDPGFHAAWELGWDAAAKKPVVKQKGTWPGDEFDKVPAWAQPPG